MSLTLEITQRIDVQDVVAIADEACAAIMAVYNDKDDAAWEVQAKADNSPLTRADRDANAVICAGLARIAPHVPIVSEENAAVPYAVRRGYAYSWCVDPLDGTKEFLKRNGQFTVNIALLRRGAPVLGVVAVPATGKAYWAAEGQGAHVRDAPGAAPRRIRAAAFDPAAPGLTIVGSASHASAETAAFVADYAAPRFEALGSSLKLLMVAEGAAHVYPRLAPTCEWDTAAAHAVVAEAGGEVLAAGACDGASGAALEDWRAALARRQPLTYNKEAVLNPFFVVYGRRVPAAAKQG